jgi:DNA-binding NarL/FixJ family response regulator
MLDVENCKILISGNCICRRGVASIVRNVVPGALIAEAFCFADARVQLNRGEFFAAIFDIDADQLNVPVSFRALRVDCPRLILGVLSRSANASDVLSYFAAGVTGYILEVSDQAEVERAVREILRGEIYIPPNVIEPAACEPEMESPAPRRNNSRLTPRQNGVLGLLLKGYSNKEIARQLNLSPHTVKIHVGALLRCFAVQKRSSLAGATAALRVEGIGYANPPDSAPLPQIGA